jgi:hypothetical protein
MSFEKIRKCPFCREVLTRAGFNEWTGHTWYCSERGKNPDRFLNPPWQHDPRHPLYYRNR